MRNVFNLMYGKKYSSPTVVRAPLIPKVNDPWIPSGVEVNTDQTGHAVVVLESSAWSGGVAASREWNLVR